MMTIATILKGRRTPSEELMKSMMVTGGSVTISDFLKEKQEWDSKTPICVPTITVSSEGTITNSRWVVLGGLKTLSWPAKNVWAGAEADLNLVIRLDDLSIFEFQAGPSNYSFWLDRADLTVGLYEGKTPVGWEEAEGRGVGGLAARAFVIPASTSEALLWVGVVPKSKEELENSLGDDVNKYWVPQISLPIGARKGQAGSTTSKAAKLDFLVKEDLETRVGMGVLPVIDSTAANIGQEKVPEGEDYKECLYRIMRSVKAPVNKSQKTIEQALTLASRGERVKDKEIEPVLCWPQYRGSGNVVGEFDFHLTILV